jgi:hypothetical protein
MGRHTSPEVQAHARHSMRAARWVAIGLVAVAASGLVVRLASARETVPTAATPCVPLKLVTASSYAPVLATLAPQLERGIDCLRLQVSVVDGRAAAQHIGELGADAWIPDDGAWANVASKTALAPAGQVAAGALLATSPIYMVTDRATAGKITKAGGTWLALARMLSTGTAGLRIAVSDPAGSGDGLVGVGGVAESIWLEQGMDASALALAAIHQRTRTVTGVRPVRAEQPGEVALVPEHTLLSDSWRPEHDTAVLTGADHTSMLRYTWLPTAAAIGDPTKATALLRLEAALVGERGTAALAAAGLRTPGGKATADVTANRLPTRTAAPYLVLAAHKVNHVFATWYPKDRRTKLLVGVDVSGSMGETAPGTAAPLIDLVRQGCLAIGNLLPPDASMTLWEFGSRLDPPRDYRTLLATAPIATTRKGPLQAAVAKLTPLSTGTGLYDTILAAFQDATGTYQAGLPNRVMIFTDGRNEDDPGSINVKQLGQKLAASADPDRPVELVVVAFGNRPEVDVVQSAIKPVGGTVDSLASARAVLSVFVHLAAGGLHSE